MNFLSKLWTAFKNYHYKFWTSVAILIASIILYKFTDWGAFNVISHIFFAGLVIFLFYVMLFHVTKNTWRDGDKVMAVIYGTLVLAMLIFIIYLVWNNIIVDTGFHEWLFGKKHRFIR